MSKNSNTSSFVIFHAICVQSLEDLMELGVGSSQCSRINRTAYVVHPEKIATSEINFQYAFTQSSKKRHNFLSFDFFVIYLRLETFGKIKALKTTK